MRPRVTNTLALKKFAEDVTEVTERTACKETRTTGKGGSGITELHQRPNMMSRCQITPAMERRK